MNIMFRDSLGELHSQDIRVTSLNMWIDKNTSGDYIIKFDGNTLEGIFDTKEKAENHMTLLTDIKNESETE